METALFKAQEKFEKEALKKYKSSPEEAIQFITEYSNQQANKAYKQTLKLLTELEIPFPSAETEAIKIKDEVPAEHTDSE